MQIKYPEIIVLNSSDSIVNSPVRKAVLKFFSWEKKRYYRTRDGMKVSNAQEDVFIVNRKVPGTFFVPTGLISNIIERLKDLEIEFKLTDEVNKNIKTKPVGKNEIPGITLRDAQVEMLADIAGKHRGVIHAATGVGKSLVSLGIFHQHKTLNPKCKILFIAHTIDLVVQAAEQFKDHFSVGVWQGKKRTDGDIICATIQTAKRVGIEKLQKMFSVLVWDETHRICEPDKSYFAFVQDSFIPYRYGLTATLPTTKSGKLTLESAIGPVISSYSINRGVEDGILAQPKVFMLVYGPQENYDRESYRFAYSEGIVKNKVRNKKIAALAKYLSNKGESVLIFVKEIPHGDNISEILKFNGVDHFWIHGSHKSDDRKATKKVIENKECLVGICSTIWNEGISINSLNNCIVAPGGKDPKAVIQIVGRGTRVVDGKTSVKIWDFLDRGKHLGNHCFDRINTYNENGWKIIIPPKRVK